MNKLTTLALAFLLLAACKKTDSAKILSVDADFLFSRYACFCINNCIQGYIIKDQQLYQGSGDICTLDNMIIDPSPLSSAKQTLAVALRDAIPDLMLNNADEVYGCPDCGDWGGYYVTLKTGNSTRSWNLDTQKASLPDAVRVFVEHMEQTFTDLE